MDIRRPTAEDDETLVEHYLALWQSYGTSNNVFLPDARAKVLSFLRHGRAALHLGAFIAVVEDEVAGSSGCRISPDLYPTVVEPSYRLNGYIWQVYVKSEFRRRGVGRALTLAAIDWLRGLGCKAIALPYSEEGRSLYGALEFRLSNEMRLAL